MPAYRNYPLRAYDVAAFQRLVYLAYQIRLSKPDTSEVQSLLESQPLELRHPVDGTPFSWNAASGELSVRTKAEQPPERRFSLRLEL